MPTLAPILDLNKDNRKKAEELLLKAGKGDRSAFSDLYDLFADALYGVVSRILQSEEAGADVLQEAFVKVWKKGGNFDPTKGTAFTWMLNIARNTAIDHLRREQKHPHRENQNLLAHVSKEVSGVGMGDQSDHVGIEDLLHKLPESQQLILRFLYFQGYTQQEVSDELEIPLGTVKTRTRSALMTLRKYFNMLLFWI